MSGVYACGTDIRIMEAHRQDRPLLSFWSLQVCVDEAHSSRQLSSQISRMLQQQQRPKILKCFSVFSSFLADPSPV